LPFSSWENNKCCGDKKKLFSVRAIPLVSEGEEKIKKLIKLKKLKKNN
jgi:hypothetical protein